VQTSTYRPGNRFFVLMLILALLAGCAVAPVSSTVTVETRTNVPTEILRATSTPQPTILPTQQASPTQSQLTLWISPDLPARFRAAITLPPSIKITSQQVAANIRLEIAPQRAPEAVLESYWIFAVVVPFPSVIDQIALQDLKNAWRGLPGGPFDGKPLLMTAETHQVFARWWGTPDAAAVQIVAPDLLLETAWQEMPVWALIPFEDIEPRWKVLRVEHGSPLDNNFIPAEYALSVPIRLISEEQALPALPPELVLPANRDPQKLTVLVMTGTTALTRNIALEMEKKGITYPLEAIRPWLADADLTHISNEVSFHDGCPEPAPGRGNRRFCSSPKYIELLEAAGTDIIELTGNHNLDWGPEPFLYSLALYRQRGWSYYGGGGNLAESQQPLLLDHNGSRLAFLGCSRAGPEHVWAAFDSPGSAPCDMDRLEQQVQQLRSQGYLPIVTFQAFETEGYVPEVAQGMPDFRRMARAGAVIVSGSQSHYPQTMTFVGDSFVHYGLGNLFFDQMSPLSARQGFIDRHIFYNGEYLGVELLTTLVEELARPRPMTAPEREKFLKTIFDLSSWGSK
jgi:hypothetical protein